MVRRDWILGQILGGLRRRGAGEAVPVDVRAEAGMGSTENGRAADGRRGQAAGLPEGEDLLQAAEDAGQAGHDEGVDGVQNPGAVLPRGPRDVAQAGELFAQGGWLILHTAHTN